MANKKTINMIAGATTVVALTSLYFFFHPYPPDIDHNLHEAVGETLAGEAVKLMEPGSRLIVIARDRLPFEVPAAEAQLEGFLRALHQSRKSVSAIHSLKLDPLRVVGVPPGDFFDLLRQGRDNDVIVSFLGPPMLADEQLAKLGEKRPRILAVCSGAMSARIDLKKLFGQKLLLAAVVSRQDAPAKASASSARSSFEQMFKLITPANMSELPTIAAVRN